MMTADDVAYLNTGLVSGSSTVTHHSAAANGGSTSSGGAGAPQQHLHHHHSTHSIPESELQQLAQSLSANETLVVVSRIPPIGRHAGCQQQRQHHHHQVQQPPTTPRPQRPVVPSLDFSRLKGGNGPAFAKNLPDAAQPVAGGEEARLDASHRAFEATMCRAVNPAAPVVDNRCYVYKAVNSLVRVRRRR